MSGPEIRIVGGTLVDGTGAPGRPGTLEVRDGRLRLTDDAGQEPAGRTIDATGKVVAPGFIDLHSHSGLMILAEPLHEPKVRQGITTEVIGVDGNSYAPFATQEDLDAFVHLNAGLDGDPRRTHKTKIDWSTVASYLARFDGTVSLNIAYLIGNSPLRIQAVGWEDVPATPSQRARMQSLLREGMEEGAYGLSSGLDYPPGSYAHTGELAELAREAGRNGGFYHTHVRYSLGDRFLDPFREAIEIGRAGRGAGPHHPLLPPHDVPGRPDRMLDLIDAARKEGLDVTFDAYPHEWASTRLLILIPIWVQAGGPIKTKERLADPNVRNRIRRELQDRGTLFAGAGGLRDVRIGYLHRKELLAWEGKTLGELIDLTDSDPVDTLCDLLAGRGPQPQRGHARAAHRRHPPLPEAPDRDGRDRLDLRWRQAEPTHIWLIPPDPRPVRPRRGAAQPRGGDPPDDVGAGGPAGAEGARDAEGRSGRGRRRLRSGDREEQRDLRRAAPVPRRHRARDRQRRAGRRERRPHRRDAGPRPPARPGLTRRD